MTMLGRSGERARPVISLSNSNVLQLILVEPTSAFSSLGDQCRNGAYGVARRIVAGRGGLYLPCKERIPRTAESSSKMEAR